MPGDYRPSRQIVALTLMASHEASTGWSLNVMIAMQSEHGVVSDRVSYSALSASELSDIIDVYGTRVL